MLHVDLKKQQANRVQAEALVADAVRVMGERLQANKQSLEGRGIASGDAARLLSRICLMAGSKPLPDELTREIFRARSVVDALADSHGGGIYDEVCDAFHRLLMKVEAFVASESEPKESAAFADENGALLRVLSARKVREHRMKADASYELGRVLAPVGKTIFDDNFQNNVVYLDNSTGVRPGANANDEQDTLPKPSISEANSHNNEPLTVVFQGRLTREAIAAAIGDLMAENKWTVRQAAKISGVSKGVFESVLYCKATIDKGLEVMGKLGLTHETRFMADASGPAPGPSVG